jgi:hypothetical protein
LNRISDRFIHDGDGGVIQQWSPGLAGIDAFPNLAEVGENVKHGGIVRVQD